MLASDNIVGSQNKYFFVSGVSSAPILEVDKKIRSFLLSNPFYQPKASVVLSALDWRNLLSNAGFTDIDAFPGHTGEILVSGICGEYCFEVTLEDNGQYSVSFERNEELFFFFEKISFAEAREKLSEATRDKWISSDGSILLISINGKTDFKA